MTPGWTGDEIELAFLPTFPCSRRFREIGQDRATDLADLDCTLQRRDHLPVSSDRLYGSAGSRRVHEPREPAHNEVNAHDGSNGPR